MFGMMYGLSLRPSGRSGMSPLDFLEFDFFVCTRKAYNLGLSLNKRFYYNFVLSAQCVRTESR